MYALQQSIVSPDLRSASLLSQVQDNVPATTTSIAADALLAVPDSLLVVFGEFNYVRSYAGSSLQLLSKYQPTAPAAGDRLLAIFAYKDVLLMGKSSAASQIIKLADHSLIATMPTAAHGSSAVNRYASMLQDSLDPDRLFACLQADATALVHRYSIGAMYRGSMAPLSRAGKPLPCGRDRSAGAGRDRARAGGDRPAPLPRPPPAVDGWSCSRRSSHPCPRRQGGRPGR